MCNIVSSSFRCIGISKGELSCASSITGICQSAGAASSSRTIPLSVSSGLRLAPIIFHLPPALASVGKTVFLTPPEPSHAYVPILILDFVSHRLRPTQVVGLVHDLRDNQAVQAFEFTGVSEADDTLTDVDETTTPSPDETATTAAIATALKVKLQHLPTSQQTAMLQVFSKHLSVFFEPAQPARIPPVAIPTRHSQPLHSAPYRLAPPMQEVIKELLEPMIQNGIVKPTISDITSPIVLVKKKDGTYRFCVDFRRLTPRLVTDQFPLPLI